MAFFFAKQYIFCMYILVIKQLIIMLILAAAGFFVTRKFHFGMKEQQYVSKTLIYFINPCLIVSNFNMKFDSQRLMQLGFSAALAFVLHLVLILIAMVFARSRKDEEKGLDCLDKISVVFTNCGFIGIPLIQGIFPDNNNAVFYLLGTILMFNIFLWTFGYCVVCGKFNLKKIITNVNIIAIVVGLIIYCMPFTLPDVLAKPLNHIASMNTATAMILLGMLFANFHGFKTEYIGRVAKVCVLRLVVSVVLCLPVVYAAYKLFPNMPDVHTMCYVAYIAALCPVAMSVSSFAVLFEKDESYSSLIVLATSAFCVITLPLSVALANLFF